MLCNQMVVGSIPTAGSIKMNSLEIRLWRIFSFVALLFLLADADFPNQD